MSHWTFFTNHAHVLYVLARSPHARMREVALQVGITERAVQRIVSDLEESGYLIKHRDGRQNHYEIETNLGLRHPLESHCKISTLLEMLLRSRDAAIDTTPR